MTFSGGSGGSYTQSKTPIRPCRLAANILTSFSHSNTNLTIFERGFHNIKVASKVDFLCNETSLCLAAGIPNWAARRHFAGCIEEVDTRRDLRFKSTDELLAFLAEGFDRGQQRDEEPEDV